MSEFDFWSDGNSSFDGNPTSVKSSRRVGKWYFPLTFLGLVLVGGLSMLMCYLTKDVTDRPIWMMGLIFMVPTGALFFSVMLLEFQTGVMTPSTSRKPQVIVAVVATLLTFLVGCACDAIYLYGGIRNAGVNYVIAVDRGDTISWSAYGQEGGPTRETELNACAVKLVMDMPAYTDVGLITFEWETLGVFPFEKATDYYKKTLLSRLTGGGNTGVSFYHALESAAEMAETDGNQFPTRILMFTGGDEAVYLLDNNGDVYDEIADQEQYRSATLSDEVARQAMIDRLKAANCSLYVISPNGSVGEGLKKVVNETGGFCVSIVEAGEKEEFVSIVTIDGDMLRADTTAAKVLTFIMLLLESAIMGVCISLMLSCSGQMRAQIVISPLMGLLCFVMMKLMGTPDSNPLGIWWLWEAISFLPLGVVVMRSNEGTNRLAPLSINRGGSGWDDVSGGSGNTDIWNISSASGSGSSVDW